MSKPLFDNVGKELKTIAEVIAKSIMFLHGLVAVVMVIIACALFTEDIPIGVGLGCLLAAVGIFAWGYILARLLVIVLYAYGELVEKVSVIEGKLAGENKPVRDDVIIKPVRRKDPPTPKTVRNPDGSWQCLFCDHTNPAAADWCEECNIQANFE